MVAKELINIQKACYITLTNNYPSVGIVLKWITYYQSLMSEFNMNF